MSGFILRRPTDLVLLLALISAPLFAASPSSPALLDSSSFSGPGASAETLLHIGSLGRYALVSKASLGARLDLVDRMAGTIASAGNESGVEASSGRIDVFLEPGEYKLRIAKTGSDTVTLSAQRYSTANAGRDDLDVPVLYDRQTVTGELHDFELLSYWVRVDAADPTLVVEMEGRSLADAALWKDGAWDTGLRPLSRKYELEPGRPITTLEYNTQVDPGLYLLICVGGPRKAWARESASDLFAVTRGGRYLGSSGVTSLKFGERGVESFLVSGNASFFQLEAKNNKDYILAVASNSDGASRFDFRRSVRIDPKSVSYRISIAGGTGGSTQWVTLQGPPGETVEVRWFPAFSSSREAVVSTLEPGRTGTTYMASVLASADGEESIDLTGLMVTTSGTGTTFLASGSNLQALNVGPGEPLHRKINLLSSLSFLLRVRSAGSYGIFEKAGAATAKYSFLLLDDWLTRPKGVSPVEVRGGASIPLQAKMYMVTLQPAKATAASSGAGILDFAVLPADVTDPAPVLGSTPASPANGLFWPALTSPLKSGTTNSLIVGMRGSIPLGISLRALPVDLSEPALVRVDPGNRTEFAFKNGAAVRVFCTNPEFSSQTARIDGSAWTAERDSAPGTHLLSVSNTTRVPQWYVIGAVRAAAVATFEVTRTAQDALPTFTEGSPLWRDFGRGELATFLLEVTQPASYRIATSGRLSMSITIRTALRTSLFSVSQNADGRNAAITSYLRPGTYLVQVRAEGSSRGRAGLLLQRLSVVDAGILTAGAVLRNSVPAGALLRTDVRIDAGDDYRLECLGLERSFSFRFEDADGWPIGQPASGGVLSTRLVPGTYHYVSAADEVQTRRLLSLALAPNPARSAYDPKAKLLAIEPNRTYSKTWVEADGRPEDVFTFTIPAQIHVLLYLSPGMLYRVVDSKGVVTLSGTGGELGETDLGPGAWRIGVKAAENDNLKEYRILLATTDLYDGTVRALGTAPQSFSLSIGSPGTVELWSYGTQEMEALLLDSADRMVARGETIPDDWNFRVVSTLVPGRYRLVLLAPGAAQTTRPTAAASSAQARTSFSSVPTMSPPGAGSSVVRVVSRATISLPATSGSLETTQEIASEVVSTAFTPRVGGVFRFDGRSDLPLSVSVSTKGTVVATGVCPVFLPLAQGIAYDVRFWHAGGERQNVVLRIGQEKAADLALGGADAAIDVKDSVLRVAVSSASGFTIFPDAADGLLFSSGTELAFKPMAGESVGAASGVGWVARRDGSPVGRLTISPLVLGPDVARAFRVGPVAQSFAVTVPQKTAAIIRTDNAGRFVGLSASLVSAFKPEPYDWQAASATALTSAIGLRTGSFRGKLWDAEVFAGEVPEGRAAVSSAFYPVASENALSMGQQKQVSVAPRTSVSFTLGAARQSVKVSLEAGMAAFVSTAGSPRGFLDAQAEEMTGVLDAQAGTITVVNESPRPALCTVEAVVPQAQASLTETAGFESNLAGARTLTFPVAADKSATIYLWGAEPVGRFLREDDGKVYTGVPSVTDFGPVVSFPAGRGVLEVASEGALMIWAAKPDLMRSGFVGKTPVARTAELGSAGATLGQAAEAWTFSLAKDAIVSLSAESGGVTAVYSKAGALIAVAAGERARTLLASLKAGAYTTFTRPLKGGGQTGILRMQTLLPEALVAEGEGAPVLIGPGERKLYRFQVKADGRVGAGIRTDRDDLIATLFDQAFRRLDAGSIFIRSLATGEYYLLVESPDSTVKFSPIVYGLEGSRTATPDDVIRSYSQE